MPRMNRNITISFCFLCICVLSDWWGKWDLNPHARNGQGSLSPLRLPIPPFPHWAQSLDSNEGLQIMSLVCYLYTTLHVEPEVGLEPTTP